MDSGLETVSPSSEKLVKSKSPWGTPSQPTQGLAAVMDEELAKKLQNDEETALYR